MQALRNDRISLAFAEIDAAHQLIGSMFERIHHAAALKAEAKSVGDMISELIDLFVREVDCEETAMILNHYPNYKEHQREHNGLLECLDDIVLDLEVNGAANIEMKIRLMWYAKYMHVVMYDRPLCEFLNSRGGALPAVPGLTGGLSEKHTVA